VLDADDPVGKTSSEGREGSPTESHGESDDGRPGVVVRHSSAKESPDREVYREDFAPRVFSCVWLSPYAIWIIVS